MVLQGRQKPPVKADLAIYSLVVGMSGLWVNVATMLNNKLDFYCCDNSVGFCKSSHIYISDNVYRLERIVAGIKALPESDLQLICENLHSSHIHKSVRDDKLETCRAYRTTIPL